MKGPEQDRLKLAEMAFKLKKSQANVRLAEARATSAEVQARAAGSAESASARKPDREVKPKGTSKYTRAAGERVCSVLAAGGTLREAAQVAGASKDAILRWVKRYAGFAEAYKAAREMGYALKAERLDELAQEAHEAAMDPLLGRQRLDACRFEADTVKWQLSKMLPKVYGDRKAVEVSGPDGKDLLPRHTQEEIAAFAAMMAKVNAEVDASTDGLESRYDGGGQEE